MGEYLLYKKEQRFSLLLFGADNRGRTCMKSLSYGPEPYASANSAISAYLVLIVLLRVVR